MTIFQFLLIVGIAAAALLAVRFLPGDRSLALKRIFALLFAVAAILAIIFPQALTFIANFFGIGRGTDLLLYVFIIAALTFGVAVMRAKARSDSRVTELARAVALMEARLADGREPTGNPPQASQVPHAEPQDDERGSTR